MKKLTKKEHTEIIKSLRQRIDYLSEKRSRFTLYRISSKRKLEMRESIDESIRICINILIDLGGEL